MRIKSQELEVKNAAANDKLKKMVKDQQEAEKKKVSFHFRICSPREEGGNCGLRWLLGFNRLMGAGAWSRARSHSAGYPSVVQH